jgi:hypothetical protein
MERWCFDASADWLEACGGQRGNPKDIERTQRTWAMPKNSHPRSVHRVVNFAGFFTSISSGLSSALGDKRKCYDLQFFATVTVDPGCRVGRSLQVRPSHIRQHDCCI